MINVPYFIVTVFAAVIGLHVIAMTQLGDDPFSDNYSQKFIDLGAVGQPTIARMKLRHAASRTKYDIGLFGNSRMLMIGTETLGHGAASVFNFSVASESFDGATMMIERLAELSRLPQIVVIGLDNLHLQRDNSPLWPSFPARLSYAVRNAVMALGDGNTVMALWRLWRFVWSETIRFDMHFDPILVRQGLMRRFTDTPVEFIQSGRGGYRHDGSQEPPGRTAEIKKISPTSSRLDIHKFRNNLKILGRFAATGHTVIIVETPVYPASQHTLEAAVPPHVQFARNEWHEVCTKLRLHCIDAPLIADKSNAPWPDATHPPETPWAKFIANAIQEAAN